MSFVKIWITMYFESVMAVEEGGLCYLGFTSFEWSFIDHSSAKVTKGPTDYCGIRAA